MGTFSITMQAWIEKAKLAPTLAMQIALQRLDGKIMEMSPVGNPSKWATPMTQSRKTGKMHWNAPKGYVGGRFRSNWQMTSDSPASGLVAGIDPTGKATLAAHDAFIASATAGGLIYLVNNLPYAVRLEQGWSYTQAPIGMVAVNIVNWGAYVAQAATDVRTGNMAAGFRAYPL